CTIINTARGGLIETEALLIGLKEEIISWCALDVLEEECAIKEEAQLLHEAFQKKCDLKTVLEEHLLIKHPRVIITPHNAFNSTEALMRILDTTIDNINSFLEGAPQNTITKIK
ncbi:hydroxyacid dehydrogenase, partial [Candidatus Woesearchaeota archaeon]